MIISPIFEMSALTVKPQLFIFCSLPVSKCGVFCWGLGWGFFASLSFPSSVPSPFGVIYNLAASAQFHEAKDVRLNHLSLPRKENYIGAHFA